MKGWCATQSLENSSLVDSSHRAGKLLGKLRQPAHSGVTMPQKKPDTRGRRASFPAKAFWEELDGRWESIGLDHLGSDHRGRFEVIAHQVCNLSPNERLSKGDVPREMIAALKGMLGLGDSEPLIDRLWEIAGRHLRPLHRRLLGSDPASTRKVLLKASGLASKLAQALDLPPVVEQYLDEFNNALPANDIGKPDGRYQVDQAVSRLAILAVKASNELMKIANRPPLALRRQTLSDAVDAVERATGKTIQTQWSKGDRKFSEFRELEGKFCRSIVARMPKPGPTRTLSRCSTGGRRSGRT